MKPFLIGLMAAFAMLACSSGPVTEADLEGRTFAYDDLHKVVIDNPEVKAQMDKANADFEKATGGMATPAYQFDKGGKGRAKAFDPFRKSDFPLVWALKGDTLYIEISADMGFVSGTHYHEYRIKKEDDGFIVQPLGKTDEYSLKPL